MLFHMVYDKEAKCTPWQVPTQLGSAGQRTMQGVTFAVTMHRKDNTRLDESFDEEKG
jgi:hypothetical protein